MFVGLGEVVNLDLELMIILLHLSESFLKQYFILLALVSHTRVFFLVPGDLTQGHVSVLLSEVELVHQLDMPLVEFFHFLVCLLNFKGNSLVCLVFKHKVLLLHCNKLVALFFQLLLRILEF